MDPELFANLVVSAIVFGVFGTVLLVMRICSFFGPEKPFEDSNLEIEKSCTDFESIYIEEINNFYEANEKLHKLYK